MKNSQSTYDFAFTAASLRLNELILVAKDLYVERNDDLMNSLGGGKEATLTRKYREYKKRLLNLTDNQKELLLNSDLNTQKQIGLMTLCKTYDFIRDFIIEVLREKFLVFDYQITEGDFITFYRRKEAIHDEMLRLTETTQNKIRTVCFRMLEETGMINNVNEKQIQPQILSNEVIESIREDNPEWLKIFFVSDLDIENYKNQTWKI